MTPTRVGSRVSGWTRRGRRSLQRFRVRLILLVLLAVLPALIFLLFSASEQRRLAAGETGEGALRLVQIAAADHERVIEETRQLLTLLTRVPSVLGDSTTCSDFLAEVHASYGLRYQALVVAEADGDISCSSAPLPPGTNVSDRSYFRLAMQTREFAVGEYVISRTLPPEPVLPMGYPITDEVGTVRRMMVTGLNLRWLNQFGAEAELPPGWVLTLMDRDGTILVRYPDTDSAVGQVFPETPLLREMTAGPPAGFADAAGFDGIERLYAFQRLRSGSGDGDLYLTIGASKAVAFQDIDRRLNRDLILLALVTALALLAAWIGGDLLFLRRVHALRKATGRLDDGDLSARTGLPAGEGELDELAGAFDRMAETLERRTAALEQGERQAREHLAGIARLNRVYAVLSGINSALLRIREPEELLRETCRIAVEEGKFRRATVHRVDPESQDLQVVAEAGTGPSAPRNGHTPPEGSHGRALAERVKRQGKQVILNDVEESASQGYYHSAGAFPIEVDGRLVAVLSLYAPEPNFFSAEELQLLSEVVADTSLGLQYIEQSERLDQLANYDPLTGLPNRSLFKDRLQLALKEAEELGDSVAVMAVRVNRIAEINAILGHHAGDVVLRELARYLEAALPAGSTASRLGSGEFGILLREVEDVEAVGIQASELLENAPQTIMADGEPVFLSLGVGVAVSPIDGEDGATLIQNATLARQAGQSEFANSLTLFSREMNARAQEKRLIEHELRRAVEENQLRLYYQPVVDVRERKVVGVESLIRWDSPELGFVSPGRFIPVAEETGLIGKIGEWILATAFEQGHRWVRAGFTDIRINVNVSVKQLRQEQFADRLQQILKDSGLNPGNLSLGLEITESELMENVEEMVPVINQFRALGMAIYIDDFGTGYSSLSYLRQLPIDTLKIDTSFVRDIPGNPDAVAVVKAILALARSLELRVIAEGVETEAQFSVLSELGCHAVQGYLFSRPLPPEEIETLFGRTDLPAAALTENQPV